MKPIPGIGGVKQASAEPGEPVRGRPTTTNVKVSRLCEGDNSSITLPGDELVDFTGFASNMDAMCREYNAHGLSGAKCSPRVEQLDARDRHGVDTLLMIRSTSTRKRQRCSACGSIGHNKRSCLV